jgi:hypothetical protein
MSETRTPIGRPAWVEEVLAHPERYQDQLRDLVSRANAIVEAVESVDGLAEEIRRHRLTEPSHAYGGARRVERSCNCGRVLAPQYFEWRHSQEMTQHVAEAVKAWLTGGGA